MCYTNLKIGKRLDEFDIVGKSLGNVGRGFKFKGKGWEVWNLKGQSKCWGRLRKLKI